ncbi:MAG: hypothetical protein VB878_08035 [Pirellulaceae bacterium]
MTRNKMSRCVVCAVAVALSTTSFAASPKRAGKIKVHDTVIGLFEGMKSGKLEVRLISKDESRGKVLIENKTDKPITIKLPATFAGVPADAQFDFGAGGGNAGFGGVGRIGGGGQGGGRIGGGGQGVGGGFNGGGNNGGGNNGGFNGGLNGGGNLFGGGGGGGGGLFNVDPEKVRRIEVTTVCLEYGKPTPNTRMEYRIVPLERVTANAQIIEICRMVGTKEVPQNAGQAAAWHLTDRLSWIELAKKNRFVSQLTGAHEKLFTSRELQLASRIVTEAGLRVNRKGQAKDATKSGSSGDKQNELTKAGN